jgi:2-methylcitrate dehydratase PrpD
MNANEILDFLYDTNWGDLPPNVQRMSEKCVFDLLGVAAGALATDATKIISNHAVQHFGAGSAGHAARLLFDGRTASPVGAALSGAMSIDSLDAHDGYPPAKGHMGVAILPAMLAVADTMPSKFDGQQFLTLVALGYELGSRMAAAQHGTTTDYHASGSWNGVATAAVLARMLELTQDQAREAMGIAEYHGPRSQMMRCIEHPTMVKDSSGWGAMTGVSSAYLAQSGFTGAPAIIVDHVDAEPFWEDLGSRWRVTEQYFKPYPICRWAHGQIAAVQFLQQTHDIKFEDIAQIAILTFYEACCLDHPNPSNTEEAQYSLPFPIAAMLVRGKVGAEEVTTGLNDPDILALARKVTMTEVVIQDDRFTGQRISKAIITMADGARYESDNTPPYGSPEFPLTDQELDTKYHDLADPFLGFETANAVKQEVRSLAGGGSIQTFLNTVLDAPSHD